MIIAQSGQIFFFPFNKKKTKKRKEIKKQKTKDPRQKSKFNDTIEGSTLRLMLLLLLYCTRLRHVEKWHKRKTVLSTRSRRCATLRRQIPSTSCTRMIGLCYFLSSKRNEKIKKGQYSLYNPPPLIIMELPHIEKKYEWLSFTEKKRKKEGRCRLRGNRRKQM